MCGTAWRTHGRDPENRDRSEASREWRDQRLSMLRDKIAQAIKVEPGLDFLSKLLVFVSRKAVHLADLRA